MSKTLNCIFASRLEYFHTADMNTDLMVYNLIHLHNIVRIIMVLSL